VLLGILLMVASVAMMAIAMPKNGKPRAFLPSGFITEMYALAVVIGFALGATWLIDAFAAWAR
jgi:hypothetical protein